MSLKAMAWALDYSPEGITTTEKFLIILLADTHNEETGMIFPSRQLLAERMFTSPRNVTRVIKSLTEKKVIVVETCYGEKGRRTTNRYHFVDAPWTRVGNMSRGGTGQFVQGDMDTERQGDMDTERQAINRKLLTGKNNTIGTCGKHDCPTEDLVDLYNQTTRNLVKAKYYAWGEGTKGSMKARWKWLMDQPVDREDTESPKYKASDPQKSLEWFQRFYKYCDSRAFLTGQTTDFKADLPWILAPAHFTAILEGRYK